MQVGYVYILQSESNGMYYIGSSEDVDNRLVQHNQGKTVATKNKGPWILKLKQEYPTIQKAKQIEYRLKKLKRKDYIEKMISDGCIKMN